MFPPINELVIGVYFNAPLLGLRAEHIGLFWHGIRDSFPKVSQTGPIVAQGEAFQAALASTRGSLSATAFLAVVG